MRNKLKRIISTNDGAAMVLAIGIMAVTVALCLSIMAYGYRNYKASLEKRNAVQTKELAVSAAGMIKKQLVGTWYFDGSNPATTQKGNTSDPDYQSNLITHLMKGGNTQYSFTLESNTGKYKESFDSNNKVDFKITLSNNSIKVVTKAKTDESGYTLTDTYELTRTKDNANDKEWTVSFTQRD